MPRHQASQSCSRRQALISFLSDLFQPSPMARPQRRPGRRSYGRLRFEALEDRRLLAIDLDDWMADLPDSVRLTDVSIPGTHDTLTYAYPIAHNAVDTQDQNLLQQLESGIRYFDIRLGKVNVGFGLVRFHGYHGGTYLSVNFDRVLKDAATFLAAHPQETILMRINTKEAPGIGTGLPSDISLLNSYLDGSHADMNGLDTRSLLYRKPHTPTQLNLVTGGVTVAESTMPTLGDVRGKMVWFMDNWGDADPTLDQFTAITTPVDNGTYDSGIEVFSQMLGYISEAQLHSGAGYTRFGATGQSFPSKTPYFVSVGDSNNPGVNKLARDFFENNLGLRSTGIITFDFPESHPDLVSHVIEQNQFGLTQLFVNVAGPAIPNSPLVDDANFKSWTADAKVANRRTVGSNTNTTGSTIFVPPSVEAPLAIFQTHRSDPPGGNDMQWDFPVVPGEYQVKLYFAESNLNTVGARVFDVSIENQIVLDNFDVFAEVGLNTALQKTFIVTVDDRLNIDFSAVVNQPMLHGIEFRKVLPAEYRVNAGGPEITTANGVWLADKELSSYSNNRHKIFEGFTSLNGLTDRNVAVPADHGSRQAQTPNITLAWNSSAGPGKWEQYDNWPNDPGGGVYQMESGAVTYTIDFIPDPGWSVDLDSFDFNNDNGGTYSVGYRVTGPISGTLTSIQRPINGSDTVHSNILPIDTIGAPGETLTLTIFNAFGGNGGNADELALDNLRFSQRRAAQPTLPAGTPEKIFQTERWDPLGQEEMRYDFPVVPGPYLVNLYFADNFITTPGGRLFDVAIEGATVLNDFDIVATASARQGVMRSYFINSDDNLDLDFAHVIDSPLLSAIEILQISTEVTLNGGTLRIADIAGGDSNDQLTISYSNGAYTISDATLLLNTNIPGATGQGTSTLVIPEGGIESIEFDTLGGNDVINVNSLESLAVSLVILGGSGDDSVFLNGDLLFGFDKSLLVDLTNDGAGIGDVDRIEVAANANVVFPGIGSATLKASRDITLLSGSSLTVEGGSILLEANQQTNALSGNFTGINVLGGTVNATGGGSVTVRGRGGDSNLGNQFGVRVAAGGKLQTNSGPLSITGTGGASTNVSNFGVSLTGQNSLASSVNGSINVLGIGGGVAGAAGSIGGIGVLVNFAASIESTGTGNVTVEGRGGVGSGGFNGGIEITGTGSQFKTNTGNLELNGVAGTGTTSTPLRIFQSSSVSSTSGNVVLIGDDAIIDPNVTIAANSGAVTIRPKTAGRTTELGSTFAGTLGLTDAELDRISALQINIGDAASGSIWVNQNIDLTGNAQTLRLLSASDVGGSGGIVVPTLAIDASSNISFVSTATNVSNVALRSQLGFVNFQNEFDGFNAIPFNDGASVIPGISSAGAITLTTRGGFQANDASPIVSAGGNILISADTSVTLLENVTTTGSGEIRIDGNRTGALPGSEGARSIFVGNGAVLSVVDGPLVLDADRGVGIAGTHMGIQLNFGVLRKTGPGEISLQGRGGDDAASGSHHGIELFNSSIETTGAAGINLQGTAGLGNGFDLGVNLEGASIISSVNGGITINGQGNAASTGSSNIGTRLFGGSQIAASGTGAVNVVGLGAGNAGFNWGVSLEGNGTAISGVDGQVNINGIGSASASGSDNYGLLIGQGADVISTGQGNIQISGTAGGSTGSSNSNIGVLVDSGGIVTSGSGASVTVLGTGGTGSGSFNYGVNVQNDGLIQTTSGLLTLSGTGGPGISSFGVRLSPNSGGQVKSLDSGGIEITATGNDTSADFTAGYDSIIGGATATGPITINANSIDWQGTTMSVRTTNSVTMQPRTAGTKIDLGGADVLTGSPITLGLTDAELDRITAGTLRIGDLNAGQITISQNINRNAATALELLSSGVILLDGGSLDSAGGNVSLTAAQVVPASSGIDVTTGPGTLSFPSGELLLAINGITVDTQYQQLRAVGPINLTNLSLEVTGNHIATPGQSFVLVASTGSISGPFANVNLPTAPVDSAWNLVYDTNEVRLELNSTLPPGPPIWQGAKNDNWTAAPSWTGSVPNSATAEAQFTTTGGANANLDVDQTVNKLTFNATTSNDYTISGPGKLTLAGTTPAISTTVGNTGDQTIATNLDLAANTTITVNGGSLSLNAPTNATLGAGVTAAVATGATLNLGGAGNALSNGTTTHANVTNNGTLAVTTVGKRVGDIVGTGTTTVTAAGATLTANYIRQSTLNIGAGNTVTVATNGSDTGTSMVTNLSINATGKLDLTNNDLVVDNGNLAALTAQLASGLDVNGSYGNGPGITSSAFANDPNFNTVLGIAANVELGYTSFSGQTVDANDVLIKYTYYGDADLNGIVDTATDFDLYITGLTSGGSLGGWLFGDFDYNGVVDSATDFDLYITGLTSQGGALLTSGIGSSNAIQAATADGVGVAPLVSENLLASSVSITAMPALQTTFEPLNTSAIGLSLASSNSQQRPEQRDSKHFNAEQKLSSAKSNQRHTLQENVRLSILQEIGESRVELSEYTVTRTSRAIDLESALWEEPNFWK